jgi:hypothetical protein
MKSQDIFLMLKLRSLEQQQRGISHYLSAQWQDWSGAENLAPQHPLDSQQDFIGEPPAKSLEDQFNSQFTVRALGDSTGISKSEVSQALQRCYAAGLAKPDRLSNLPKVNESALQEFLLHGLRYVFPVKPAEITRGIATAWAAPVLQQKISSGSEIVPVWPDANGNTRGQAIEPLYKSVPYAVRRDAKLYALLAVVDSIRIGQARERKIASDTLSTLLGE